MKRLFFLTGYLCALLSAYITTFSQTTESFNSRKGISSSQVTDFLQQKCWQFYGFGTAVMPLEGDGSLVSATKATTGIYTPVLNIKGNFSLRFKYAFLANSTALKSLKIYLTDGNNEIVHQVDSIDVTSGLANTPYEYNNTIVSAAGSYRLYIKYDGGSAAPIVLDQIEFSANLRYPEGCNIAPTAVDDIITGTSNRSATGYVTENDMDPNGEAVASYLITSCTDGTVNLATNGYFSFTPNPGFIGNQASFTYQICDSGSNQLCSPEAKVTLVFPAMSSFPLTIADVEAITKSKAVDVRWTASGTAGIERFELERSTDGISFEKAGTVSPGVSNGKRQFVLTDPVTEKMMKKNDLFYRIRQVNRDGEIKYSKTIIVRVFKSRTLQSVTVAPNATVNDIRVNFQLNENAFIVMKLTSSAGEETYRKSTKAMSGTNGYTLEGTGNIRKGMYVLEVIVNSNERMVVKVIKG